MSIFRAAMMTGLFALSSLEAFAFDGLPEWLSLQGESRVRYETLDNQLTEPTTPDALHENRRRQFTAHAVEDLTSVSSPPVPLDQFCCPFHQRPFTAFPSPQNTSPHSLHKQSGTLNPQPSDKRAGQIGSPTTLDTNRSAF